MMNSVKYAFLSLIVCGCISCVDDNGIEGQNGTPLDISVATEAIASRGVIESASFPSASELGVTFLNANGTAYDGKSYTNIKATAAGTGNTQTWSLASKVLLSGTSGTLYAYYPYSSSVTDVAAVPVSASSSNQTDYMYATPVTGLHDGNPKASVTMRHALAAVRISLVKGTYTGAGQVTAVSVKGNGMATSATLNAKTGGLSACSGMGTNVKVNKTMSLSATAQQTDIIFVPVSTVTDSPVFTVTVDGKDYSVTGSAVKFEQNNIYSYTLTVNSKAMGVSDVNIGKWNYSNNGNPVINIGYNIVFSGNTDGIAFDVVTENEWITIKALPVKTGSIVNNISSLYEGMKQSVDEYGVLTIRIDSSKLKNDVVLVFDGCNDFNGWVKLTYLVTDTSKDTQILSSTCNIDDVDAMMINDNGTLFVKDLTLVNVSKTYRFSSVGVKVVFIKFKDTTSIPGYCFYSCRNLLSAIIPDECISIKPLAFFFCDKMTYCFIPNSVKTIEDAAFNQCFSFKDFKIPDSVETISDEAFQYLESLESLVIGNGVKNIGIYAFEACYKLSDVVFGSNLVFIDSRAFASCYELRKITSLSVTAPVLDDEVFVGGPEDGVLYIPEGSTGYDKWLEQLGERWVIEYI